MHFPLAHNGIVVAIIAHGLIGVSLIWDKVLLRRPETTNLPSFVFWLGLISVFGLVLIPFGFHWPGREPSPWLLVPVFSIWSRTIFITPL